MDQDFVPKTRTIVRSLLTRYTTHARYIFNSCTGLIVWATLTIWLFEEKRKYIDWELAILLHFQSKVLGNAYLRRVNHRGLQMVEKSLRRNEKLTCPCTNLCIYSNFLSGSLAIRFYERRDRLWSTLGVLSLRELFNEWDFVLTNLKRKKKKKRETEQRGEWLGGEMTNMCACVREKKRERQSKRWCVNVTKRRCDFLRICAWCLRGREKKHRERSTRIPCNV